MIFSSYISSKRLLRCTANLKKRQSSSSCTREWVQPLRHTGLARGKIAAKRYDNRRNLAEVCPTVRPVLRINTRRNRSSRQNRSCRKSKGAFDSNSSAKNPLLRMWLAISSNVGMNIRGNNTCRTTKSALSQRRSH